MRRQRLKPIILFLICSFALHLFFALTLYTKSTSQLPSTETQVEVTYLDMDEARAKKALQVVEQETQLNDEVDKNAKFLSAFDQKVNQQTRADKSGEYQNSAGGGKVAEEKKPKPKEKGEMPSLQELTPSFKSQSQHAGQGPNDDLASQTDDHLKNVEKGLQTLLSTREFVYYSYYSRIKKQIRQYWEPGVREKVKIVYKQGRTIASAKDRVTQLMIVLDKNGQLIKVEVLSASGVHDLDEAAIEAFESAAPFPNPPEGMVESDGTIKIRWDFILEA